MYALPWQVKAFDESKHPRGQPENAGEFASAPGGNSIAKEVGMRLSQGIQDEATRKVIEKVIGKMTPGVLGLVEANVRKVVHYKTLQEISGLFGDAGIDLQGQQVGGFYLDGDREVHINSHLPLGTFAHEIGHAIDHHSQFSGSEAWQAAWAGELKDGRLSNYAATNSDEGFAEFARLVLLTDVGGREAFLAKEFPKCWDFWKSKGLN